MIRPVLSFLAGSITGYLFGLLIFGSQSAVVIRLGVTLCVGMGALLGMGLSFIVEIAEIREALSRNEKPVTRSDRFLFVCSAYIALVAALSVILFATHGG